MFLKNDNQVFFLLFLQKPKSTAPGITASAKNGFLLSQE
ncbi:Uncharacterized protein dnm_039770 [Desulfonema magnum]|uniref:Uncharacterized protein n=1 Tax=Desulfonema magnum TaxID=45655 RepID=A0A975BM00_9BACT|nr:Uncharacterized protein dnm_039770 [Desulfonema magnum]